MNRKQITLNFSMEQVCNDILSRCYVVSQGLVEEAQKDIRAIIESPDSDETRSIINRAVTEAIANIKLAAQRYLTTGRVEDNNNLERLVKSGTDGGTLVYETVTLTLEIPNWNIAVTDALKSHMHRYIVDYVMSQFLADSYADKAEQYAASVSADYKNIQSDLLSRDNYTLRRPSFT